MKGRYKKRRSVFILAFLHLLPTFCWTQSSINVLFVNEEGNSVAEEAVDAAMSYIKRTNKLGLTVGLQKVILNGTDTTDMLNSICATYDSMLEGRAFPHLVLDTTKTGLVSETVKYFTAALALPTVSASFGQVGDLRQWRNIDADEEAYLIQISPPADIIPEIVRVLVINENMTNVAILFDSSFVMDHKYKSLLANVGSRHLFDPIAEDDKQLRNQLKKLTKLKLKTFFILACLPNIKRVLDAAAADTTENLFTIKHAWHAITQDKGDLKLNARQATVIFVNPQINENFQGRLGTTKTLFQLNAEPEIEAAFYFDLALHSFLAVNLCKTDYSEMMSEGYWPESNVTNYLTCDGYDGKNSPKRVGLDLRKYLKKICRDSSETLTFGQIDVSSNGQSFMEFQMQISAVHGSPHQSKHLGIWRAGFQRNVTLLNPGEMKNYKAAVIYKVVVVEQKPFVIRDEKAPKGFRGYCIDIMDQMTTEILEVDYEIYAAPDGKFGNADENGNWDGMVKELMDKKADIAIGPLSVTAQRETVIDFTVPFYDAVGITILMKMPEASTSLFKFLTVLEDEVWLCILGAYVFTSFLMWVFDRWSPYSYQTNREKYKDDEEKREFNLKECLWFCMTSLTPQGGGEAPKNLSGRLVAATWWLFGFIIISSYTANLAAFLTVSRLDAPIESLDDLSQQYQIQYGTRNGSSAMTYFQRMADIEARFYEIWKDMSLNDNLSQVERAKLSVWDYPVATKFTKMWHTMKDVRLPNTLEEAVAKVRASTSSEGFAYLGDADEIRYLELTNCDLMIVGEEFSKKPYAFAVQQGSPLKHQLDSSVLFLLNWRRFELLKDKWWEGNPEKKQCEVPEDQSRGISIRNVAGLFIVIFVGIVLACFTLAFEYWWYKFRKNAKVIKVQEASHGNKNVADFSEEVGIATNEVAPLNVNSNRVHRRLRF